MLPPLSTHISRFNWIWKHSRLHTTAAQSAGLAMAAWSWKDLVAYPTVI